MPHLHFSDDFRPKAEAFVVAGKAQGKAAHEVARELEQMCGKANEEFAIDGLPLIAVVFDGYFKDGTAGSFVPNPPKAVETAAERETFPLVPFNEKVE